MNITATELNKRPGTYLKEALKEPVVVEKEGKSLIVIVAYDQYIKFENAYWGERALQSSKEKSLSEKETMKFLLKDT